ncbi:MAG: hypothetical protein ABWJ42_06140 [Sulfolobales archaeon]
MAGGKRFYSSANLSFNGMVFENPIFYVERLKHLIDSGVSVSERDVRRAGELLGTPFKRVEVFQSRYEEVFSRFIEKRCCEAGSGYSVCIYSWNRKRSFKSFPVSHYATGTIILFRDREPLEVLSTPLPKALDYSEESEPVSRDSTPIYVSKRVDGWQVNAYYDKLLERWIFSTRYVLHNMYFSAGRLKIDPYGEISNPIVSLADAIAFEEGLYERLERFRGWVFIFSLLGPEPVVTSPPYPIGADPKSYKLYLVAARDSEGNLHPGSRVSDKIDWRYYAEEVEIKRVSDLYDEIKNSLTLRSYVAWFEKGFETDPLLVEIPSKYYYDAMMVKHLYDAKSASVLCSESVCSELIALVENQVAKRSIESIKSLISDLSIELERVSDIDSFSITLAEKINSLKGSRVISSEEIAKELRSKNIKRLIKKILSLALEERSLLDRDIENIVKTLREVRS